MPTVQNWKVSDYWDAEPGVRMGLAIRETRNREAAQKQMAVDRAAQLQIQRQQQAMQQAQAMSQLGVPPVMTADGQIDWMATAQEAQRKRQTDEAASALAEQHAWTGGPVQMTPEEQALALTPEYGKTYRKIAAERGRKEAEQAAIIEQIGHRVQGQIDAARERGKNVTGATATVTKDLPGGGTIRVPVSQEEAKGMLGDRMGTGQKDKVQEALDDLDRFEQAGLPVDLEWNSKGFPVVTKSAFWHRAQKSKQGSYEAVRQEIIKRAGLEKPAPQGGSTNVLGSRPMLVYPAR